VTATSPNAPRRRALTKLRADGVRVAAIDQLLAENRVPLIEGVACTFLFRGHADGVAVEHAISGLPAPLPLKRLRRSDLWYASIELPPGSRVEYRLLVRHGDRVDNILDPLNPESATGPASTMSVLRAEGYTTPSWALPDPAVVTGELTELRFHSKALRREAHVTVYSPARMRREHRLPLLVVHDGGDYLKHASFGTVLDNLMDQRTMSGCVVAFTHPGERLREYGASAAHSRFLTAELVPLLEERLPLRAEPAGRVLAGASFGAIAALSAAWRAPGFYGGLLLQSASFLYTVVGREHQGGPAFDPVVRFVNAIRAQPQLTVEQIFLSYGAFEPSAQRNLAMVDVLRRMASEVKVVESLDGHTWTGWRDHLCDGLSWLFPGERRLLYP
jgi:enterochelin esterase-like enzyme